MENPRYKSVLDSLKNGGCIDDESYIIMMSSDIDESLYLANIKKSVDRMLALSATGLTEDQSIRIEVAYMMLAMGECDLGVFNEIYMETKKWYEITKEEKRKAATNLR